MIVHLLRHGVAEDWNAAGDAARSLTEEGVQKLERAVGGWRRIAHPIQRVFVLLVLEHAEVLDWQNLCVERYRMLLDEQPEANRRLFEGFLDYAEQHQRVIARFGRFPHRNLVLERPSTSEEMDFLLEPGSRF